MPSHSTTRRRALDLLPFELGWQRIGAVVKNLPQLLLLLLAATSPMVIATAAGAAAASTPATQLRELFAASDEAHLQRNPLDALARGDLRYASQFGDYISDAYFAAEKRAALRDLAALARIDRNALGTEDRISYDVFKYQRTDDLKGLAPALLKSIVVRPIDHYSGAQSYVPQLSSGEGLAPFRTVADYDNNLRRLEGYIVYLDRAIARMKQGLAAGVTNPKLTMSNTVQQLDLLIAEGIDHSTFYKPVMNFPVSVPAADRARLTAAYREFIRGKLIPAHTRLREFINNQYLPHARDSVGLAGMPGGPALYRYLVASRTTTAMTPRAIHELGLAEVARITAEMDKVRNEVGFKGDLKAFARFMITDPRFAPATAAAVRDTFVALNARLTAVLPSDFAQLPKSRLEIRPVPAYKAKNEAAGGYEQGTPDGSRPGVFYYNTYDLPSRFTWGNETLFLHEGVPGHHLQGSLAQENTALPAFQRFGGNTAYVEGWALYAESLGEELGMFTDPYQMYGHLNDEMLRAMRLVVDTGIHTLGWSREQAISYMTDNSAMGQADVTAEVERYIALPGQALAYKIGQLTIRRLRTRAERELGYKFDVREFHAQVLMSGALPMAVLEKKIDNWIAARRS
jgi:uncharacterized protein (DUF885 family)